MTAADKTIIAYFDMDRTVLRDSSGMLYMRYLRGHGMVDWRAMLTAYWYAALYKLGLLSYPDASSKLASTVSHDSEAEQRLFCQRCFDDLMVNYVSSEAVQRINDHRSWGHRVTIISASTSYVVGPLARHLGISDYLCTRLEVADGRFTGRIVQPACYGPGKVHWASDHAHRLGARLADSYFYSDSYSDLALLEHVGQPVAVNPDARLKAHAVRHGWPIEYFH